MAIAATFSVFPDTIAFPPDAFADLLQREISLPSLARDWTHTLVDIAVADDGSVAHLRVLSEPPHPIPMDDALRIVTTTPAARVRVVDEAGEQLVEGAYPAPLQEGQRVAVGDRHYVVVSVDWPGRDPISGTCRGAIDWQVATVSAEPVPPQLPEAT